MTRYKEIQKVHIVILLINTVTCISKLAVGYLTNSTSITADGFHSMTDGLNNIAGMVGAYNRLLNPVTPTVTAMSFMVMLITIIVNIFITIYEKIKGMAIKSDFLVMDASHTLSDVFVSFTVIITLFTIKLGFPWIDIVISVFIPLIIGKAGLDIINNVTNVLCDAVAIDPIDISNFVCQFEEIYSCHKVRSRGRDDDIHVDLHVVTVSDLTLEKSHLLVHKIDNAIRLKFPGVTDLNVHVDFLKYYLSKKTD